MDYVPDWQDQALKEHLMEVKTGLRCEECGEIMEDTTYLCDRDDCPVCNDGLLEEYVLEIGE